MPRIFQFLFEMLCVAVLAFIMALLFVDGWDKQEQIDAEKREARMHQMIEREY